MNQGLKRQQDKEKAVQLGIERGMALSRDELKIYGVRADGSKELITEGKDYEELWAEAVKVLERMPIKLEKSEEYLNNWKRAQADFENYCKDEAKRMAEVIIFANERMILEVADIIDNLEMVLKHAPPDTKQDWLDGARQILKQWQAILKKHGIERIVTEGKQFDPHKHEAVNGQGSTITEEIRAGYEMNGKVIRPARVTTN